MKDKKVFIIVIIFLVMGLSVLVYFNKGQKEEIGNLRKELKIILDKEKFNNEYNNRASDIRKLKEEVDNLKNEKGIIDNRVNELEININNIENEIKKYI